MADELETDIRHGDWIDPRQGETTVGELWEQVHQSRRLESASRKRDESHWRCHVRPAWRDTPIGAIMRPDVTAWIVRMEREEVGAATIQGAVGVLRAILEHAVDARLIRANPAAGVKPPRRAAHQDRVLAPEEDSALLDALDRVAPGRPDGRLLAELMLSCGLRWEEAAALDRQRVRTRDGMLDIGPVVERGAAIRPYPKSPAGRRTVPVPEHLWPAVRQRALAAGPGGLLIPSPRGGVLDYSHWRVRTWLAALQGLAQRPATRGRAHRAAVVGAGLDDPQPTPHDLRHTAGTRLAEEGVPTHEIMDLMGHESLASVQRYLHAGEGRHTRVRSAMARVHSGRAPHERQDGQTTTYTQQH